MIALSLPEIKDFMNKLLCTDTFGHFLLKEAVILGSVTWLSLIHISEPTRH